MFKRIISAALVFGTAALAPPAHAQNAGVCLPRENLIETLKSKYHEDLYGGGLQNSESLLEIWSSPTTGSFTVIVTRPNGIACIVAGGQYWHFQPAPRPGEVAG